MEARNTESFAGEEHGNRRKEADLKKILLRYHNVVHTLAMHLTNSEDAAEKVVLEVFRRFSQEHHKNHAEPLDSVIHRFTYDAALPLLLEQITEHTEELDVFGMKAAGSEQALLC